MLYSSLLCANAHPGSMICALEEKWEAWSHRETKEMPRNTLLEEPWIPWAP